MDSSIEEPMDTDQFQGVALVKAEDEPMQTDDQSQQQATICSMDVEMSCTQDTALTASQGDHHISPGRTQNSAKIAPIFLKGFNPMLTGRDHPKRTKRRRETSDDRQLKIEKFLKKGPPENSNSTPGQIP